LNLHFVTKQLRCKFAGEAFMQMFDDAPRKRSRQEKLAEIEVEHPSSETDSADSGSEQDTGQGQAGRAEEVIFESGR